MQLNPQQELVANHRLGRALTLACPGSGKTKTITERTSRLINEGVSPQSIISITFTNFARDEMKERLISVVGPEAKKVYISNFHGLCGDVLRRFGEGVGYTSNMTVVDSDDQESMLKRIMIKRATSAGYNEEEMKSATSGKHLRFLGSVINNHRENLREDSALDEMVESTYIDEIDRKVLREYVKTLNEQNQCDFSGMLSEMVRLLEKDQSLRERLQRKFRFIQVDEYQDTNMAQNKIVELIAGPEDNVLAVGDLDQSIYTWRGANPESINTFISNGQSKNGCEVFKLGVNYRSTPQIITTAAKLIQHAIKRESIEFQASRPDGDVVLCRSYPTNDDEANNVAVQIRNLIADGKNPEEIAVFYRTNDMSRALEQALTRQQVPYRIKGGGSFYDRMEIKDMICFLRVLCNPKDSASFHRIANKPTRGLGDVAIGMLDTYAEKQNVDLLQALHSPSNIKVAVADKHGTVSDKGLSDSAQEGCRQLNSVFNFDRSNMNIHQSLLHMTKASRYEDWIKSYYKEKGDIEERLASVYELQNSISTFCSENPNATLADYLQSISLYTQGDDKDKSVPSVQLMSMHTSKGLEFEAVFCVGIEEGIMPHKRACDERPEAGLEEERRLLYVAMTRAKQILRLSYCFTRQSRYSGKTGRFDRTMPSRFLFEAGLLNEEDQIVGRNPPSPSYNRDRSYYRR